MPTPSHQHAARHLRFVPPSLTRAGGIFQERGEKFSPRPIPHACGRYSSPTETVLLTVHDSFTVVIPDVGSRDDRNSHPFKAATPLLQLRVQHPRHNLVCCTSSGSCIQSVYSRPAARSPALLPCCPAVCSLPIEVHRPLPCRAL